MIEDELFDSIISDIKDIKKLLSSQSSCSNTDPNRIYTNAEVKTMLGIGDKTLKKLRDNNLLPFHSYGKEYWYTQADIDQFMEATKVPSFSI